MLEKSLIKHYIKRSLSGAAAALFAAALMYGSAAKELRLTCQLDNDCAGIIPAPENNISATVYVNINTASEHFLQRLDGIGPETARAIVEYREENGKFNTPDELLNVKGIGEKTLEKIRERVVV